MQFYSIFRYILRRPPPGKWLQLGRTVKGGSKSTNLFTGGLWNLLHLLLINLTIPIDIHRRTPLIITVSQLIKSSTGGRGVGDREQQKRQNKIMGRRGDGDETKCSGYLLSVRMTSENDAISQFVSSVVMVLPVQ